MKKSQKNDYFRVSSDPFIGSDTAGSCVTLLMRSHVRLYRGSFKGKK